MLVGKLADIHKLARGVRTNRRLRQIDIALHAGLSRQWIVEFERGKPSLEYALVLRALAAYGIEIKLEVREPPDWQRLLTADAEMNAARIVNLRHRRRAARNAAARAARSKERKGRSAS